MQPSPRVAGPLNQVRINRDGGRVHRVHGGA